jgi:hypothetical protein
VVAAAAASEVVAPAVEAVTRAGAAVVAEAAEQVREYLWA